MANQVDIGDDLCRSIRATYPTERMAFVVRAALAVLIDMDPEEREMRVEAVRAVATVPMGPRRSRALIIRL